MACAPSDTPATSRAPGHADAEILVALRASYPHFRLWPETIKDRPAYIARRLIPGSGPHTVVTPDLTELRAALRDAPAP